MPRQRRHGGEHGPGIVTRLFARDDEALATLVRDGLPAAGMPGFPIPDQDMKELAAFLRTPPSVVIRCRWGCHCRRSPAVATQTTIPGRASFSPLAWRTNCLTASAPARASSPSSSRRRRNSGRKQAWDGQYHVAVCDGQQHILAQPLRPQELLPKGLPTVGGLSLDGEPCCSLCSRSLPSHYQFLWRPIARGRVAGVRKHAEESQWRF